MGKKEKMLKRNSSYEKKDYSDFLKEEKSEIPHNKKKRMRVVTYYSQSTNDFMKGINEMRDSCKVIAEILGDQELNPDAATSLLVTHFLKHVPSLEEKKNLMWSLNVSANKVVLKTGNMVTFGWKLRYDSKKEENIVISDIVFQVNLFGNKMINEVGSIFEDLGWEKSE